MATLKDVAKEAGLTVSTVSRVLNNRGYISDEARKKVAAAMKKLNYHPNEVARSLQNKRSNVIGVLVPHIQHPYFAEVINYLEDAAYRRGYKMFLFNTMGREDKAREYLNLCSASRVEGIVLCTGNLSEQSIENLSVPLVALERPLEHCSASVLCDNRRGGEMAAERLIEAGCRNILYIGSITDIQMPADERSVGFADVCEKQGVTYSIYRTDVGNYNSLRYYQLLESIFDENPEVDGIFASSDIIGAQVLQVCAGRHIAVPDKVKVIGFDDVIIATMTTPQLTTIHQPVQEMAESAMDLICRAIEGEVVVEHMVLPVSLVERGSV